LLGATGGTGRQVLAQALEAGASVTAVVRNPERLSATSVSARIVEGDIVREPSLLDDSLIGQDAVISTLGVGKSFKPAGLIACVAPAIVAAMQRRSVQRLVFTSAFGVGPTWSDTPLIPRMFMRTLLRKIYSDKAAGEVAIRNSSLDWTLVYPTGLTNGPRTSTFRMGEHLPLSGFPRISRADVAEALLKLLDDPSSIGKSILVSA